MKIYDTGKSTQKIYILKSYPGHQRSLSIKHGLCMANGVGVVDSDYRGELKVPMVNLGREAYTIQPGERVAQLCIAPVYTAAFVPAEELGDTQRGEGGFGSTGK